VSVALLRFFEPAHRREEFWIQIFPSVLGQMRPLASVAVPFSVVSQVPDDPKSHRDGTVRAEDSQQRVFRVVADVIHEVMAHAFTIAFGRSDARRSRLRSARPERERRLLPPR
jgi:hypothetical protein